MLDIKAHLFWEIPAIDAKVCDFMDSNSNSGDAKRKLIMTGDTKDAKTFFSVKKRKLEQNTKLNWVCRFFIYNVQAQKKNC